MNSMLRIGRVLAMNVYIDVLLLVNFVMNSIILLLTAWAAGISYKVWRILIAAGLGGVYVVSGVWPQLIYFHSAPFKLLISLLLVLLAFGARSIRINLLLVGIFYIVSFIMGGAVVGWLYFWQNSSYLQSNYMKLTAISLDSLVKGTVVGVLLVLVVMRRIMSRMSRKLNFYQITIAYADRQVDLVSMLDTGNCLYTVLGRKPVVLVERSKIEMLLSESVVCFLNLYEAEAWMTNLDKCQDHDWLERVQIIPYKAVGHNNMLLGFRPDKVTVITEKGRSISTEVVIAIYNGHLSSDGTYAALLHPLVVNNIVSNEEVGVCA